MNSRFSQPVYNGNTSNFCKRQSRRWKAKRQPSLCTIGSAKGRRQIDYPGSNNKTEFIFDSQDLCSKIIETVNGTVTSTKQFVWCNDRRCEERDGSGSLTKKFLAAGQINGSTKYFYITDHLGSIRMLTDNSGVIQQESNFDPFGRKQEIVANVNSDFNFTGFYTHERSKLELAVDRAFLPSIGRWISRDLAGSAANLYAYVANSPFSGIDPSGNDFVDLWVRPVLQTEISAFGFSGVWQTNYGHYSLVVEQCNKFSVIEGYFTGPGVGRLIVRIQRNLTSEQAMGIASRRGGQVVENVTTSRDAVKRVLSEADRLQSYYNSFYQPYFLGSNQGPFRTSNSVVSTVLKNSGLTGHPSPYFINVGM